MKYSEYFAEIDKMLDETDYFKTLVLGPVTMRSMVDHMMRLKKGSMNPKTIRNDIHKAKNFRVRGVA